MEGTRRAFRRGGGRLCSRLGNFLNLAGGIPLAGPPLLAGARSSTARRRTLSAVRDSADESYRYGLRGIPYEEGSTGTKKRTLSPCEDDKRGWWKI